MSSKERRLRHHYLKSINLEKASIASNDAFSKRLQYLYEPYGFQLEASTNTRLFNLWKGLVKGPKTFPTTTSEVERLEASLELPLDLSYADVFCGKGTIAKALPQLKFLCNDIQKKYKCEFSFDVFDPSKWPKQFKRVDAFISSPPFELLDIALVDLYNRCSKFVAIHCAGDFASNATPYRTAFFTKLQKQRKAALVYGLPNVNGRRCCWVIACKQPSYMRKLLKSTSSISTFIA